MSESQQGTTTSLKTAALNASLILNSNDKDKRSYTDTNLKLESSQQAQQSNQSKNTFNTSGPIVNSKSSKSSSSSLLPEPSSTVAKQPISNKQLPTQWSKVAQHPLPVPVATPQMHRSNSLQSNSLPHTMQRTASTPISKPSTHYHPIAIRPKPIAISPAPSSVMLSRNSSIINNAGSERITLTTSKNWVLPPRPKTKKVVKKKEVKKGVKPKITNCSGITKSNNTNANNANATTGNATALNSPSSSTFSNNNILHQSSTIAHKTASSGSLNSLNPNTTKKKTILSKNTKSVKAENSGKVSINSQIHSNINLFTNNQTELKVQLQNVSKENDNLKKILVKLNKEINNLRLIKVNDTVNTDAKFTNNNDSLSKTNRNSLPIPKSFSAVSPTKSDFDTSSTNASTENAKISMPPFALTLTPELASNSKSKLKSKLNLNLESKAKAKLCSSKVKREPKDVDVNPSREKLFNEANTIDPVNLSYKLDLKRIKLSQEPELEQEVQGLKVSEMGIKSSKEQAFMSPKDIMIHPIPVVSKSTKDNNDTNRKKKSKSDKPKSKGETATKEYHSCGLCEIGQKCICFENQRLSMAASIAAALSKGIVNVNVPIPTQLNNLPTELITKSVGLMKNKAIDADNKEDIEIKQEGNVDVDMDISDGLLNLLELDISAPSSNNINNETENADFEILNEQEKDKTIENKKDNGAGEWFARNSMLDFELYESNELLLGNDDVNDKVHDDRAIKNDYSYGFDDNDDFMIY